MDYETVSAEEFGASLRGMGLNLLVRDVEAQAQRLAALFGMTAFRVSRDFAILQYGTQVFQLHADSTYATHPLLNLLPENPPRGAGVQIHLFDTDPDDSAERAEALGFTILQPPTDKPHGLRECFLLCEDGYAWVPSRPL
ncbi:VOC family protein [Marivita geojedonensis]|uniref:Glyoxalase n=1 Tax=Marivita geojedonensis TaxID=1123756 RepID=A0A1X4NPC8_9RHOB|nr:VOC family protein [Marivita geojedonensis]OSQ52590.1 glyoxalase [Marivita geojedonensis]